MNVLIVIAHPNPKSFCHAILAELSKGLRDGGHTAEVIDLYATDFNPVFGLHDFAFFADETVPEEVLEGMRLKERVLALSGGPVRRFIARRWLHNRELRDVVKLIGKNKPKDVLEQQQKVAWAEGLVFIAPVFWLGLPAILKGWIERVFSYGFAYSLSAKGWAGDVSGRVPLLQQKKSLIVNTTFFKQEDYEKGLEAAMEKIIDDWSFRYPGIQQVDHVYFYATRSVDEKKRQEYLQRAYRLGKEY